MNRKPKPDLIDDENPEWTAEDFARAKRLRDLPPAVQAVLSNRARGPQKTPVKTRISIRLSQDVLATFRASGAGWQTRIDAALKEWLKTHTPG
jgi:uncharacterized protein (DUF4415 family)